MSKASLLTALSLSCVMATSAMAQIIDNNIPAGAPNHTSGGAVSRSSVPPILDTAPVSGRSSSCSSGIGCQSVPMVLPRGRH
jgi:hypothetical protein